MNWKGKKYGADVDLLDDSLVYKTLLLLRSSPLFSY